MERRALTLVELLVVLVVIGVLFAITVAAVQASRESARKVQCSSNMRQIALALLHYEEKHRAFPAGSSNGLSFHVAILPMMEQQSVYNQLDYALDPADQVMQRVSIATYRCPSDGADFWVRNGESATTNYAGNCGVWLKSHGYNGMFRYTIFRPPFGGGPVKASEVINGLSSTVMASEILRASMSRERQRVVWNTPRHFTGKELEELCAYCDAIPPAPAEFGWRGHSWFRGAPWTRGGVGQTWYNHALGPNRASCFNMTDVLSAIVSATSLHGGGVNTVFADGHVAWIADEIDKDVWREMGSRVKSAR